jgi:hypothetical protein
MDDDDGDDDELDVVVGGGLLVILDVCVVWLYEITIVQLLRCRFAVKNVTLQLRLRFRTVQYEYSTCRNGFDPGHR